MKIVCYYAAAAGAHPDADPELYDRIWPIMLKSFADHGHDVIHLTDLDDMARSDLCYRFDVDPKTVIYSRELAWLGFLNRLAVGEVAVLVEPDAILRKPIAPLEGDMLLLTRPGKSIPCGFRMATRAAIPFYEEIVRRMGTYPREQKVFHGDVRAHRETLKLPRGESGYLPSEWDGVLIESRPAEFYTDRHPDATLWNFKGRSKKDMLQHR